MLSNHQIINALLYKLDTILNSNTCWVELEIPTNMKAINKVLLQHLRTGNFHFELAKQDASRGWGNYVEVIFIKDYNSPILL